MNIYVIVVVYLVTGFIALAWGLVGELSPAARDDDSWEDNEKPMGTLELKVRGLAFLYNLPLALFLIGIVIATDHLTDRSIAHASRTAPPNRI